jgi:hypothetical protein
MITHRAVQINGREAERIYKKALGKERRKGVGHKLLTRVMVVTRIDESLGCLIQLTPHKKRINKADL